MNVTSIAHSPTKRIRFIHRLLDRISTTRPAGHQQELAAVKSWISAVETDRLLGRAA